MGKAVRLRNLILLLLMVHVFVHPMMHASATMAAAPSGSMIKLPLLGSSALASLDDCDLCRVAQGAMLWTDQPRVERFSPLWISVCLQAVSCASLGIKHRLPSRAPPSL